MEKINIAELLKDCPSGLELDCTMFENVSFVSLQNSSSTIVIHTPDGYKYLNSFGCYHDSYRAKCVIFPKGKTTWEGFVPPCKFKDGDVLVHTQNDRFVMSIYKSNESETIINTYTIFWDRGEGLSVGMQICCYTDSTRLATEKEKEELFKAIKDNGYEWNPESKTLEKFIESKEDTNDEVVMSGIYFDRENYANEVELHLGNYEIEVRDGKTYAVYKNQETKISKPIFKIGDKIKHKDTVLTIVNVLTNSYVVEDEPDNFGILMFSQQDKWELINEPKFKVGDRVKHIPTSTSGIVVHVDNKGYYIDYHNVKGICYTSFILENDYELMPNKFDINTLKPFESKVLVRNKNHYKWEGAVFGRYDGNTFFTIGGADWRYCIPYKGNEHLFGNTDDCNDYFKTWEK